MKNRENAPLEIYIHIPFCVRKCQYCDFLSGPADNGIRKAYVQALLKEIRSELFCAEVKKRKIVSVFLGGGTPSILEAEEIGEIMTALGECALMERDVEVTIEANPGTLTPQKLRTYREAGIGRLSLGLQSADDRELRMLGRIHTWGDFLESFRIARQEGFSNINVDLISAIPGQSYESWIRSLRTVAELGTEHISAYSLIIEPGTPFAQQKLELPDEDTEYRMYEDTAAVLGEYGYHQYEISNYAKRGFECRHNLGYWTRREYLGFGLGASSLLGECRFRNTDNMEEYLKFSGTPDRIRRDEILLSQKEQEEEFLFLGLRRTEGISEKEFERIFGLPLEAVYGRVLEKYKNTGFLEKRGEFWRFTRKGIHVSNHILADFLQD